MSTTKEEPAQDFKLVQVPLPTSVKMDELRERLCEIERTKIDVFKNIWRKIDDVVRLFVLNIFPSNF